MKQDGKRGRFNGALDGGITIFLSLILTCICALLGGLYESARLAGGGWYLQMALNSSLDSLMSGYHRELWERYRLFLLEYETGEQLRREVESACRAYLEEASYYRMEPEALSVSVLAGITSESCRYLEEQILDYMKFGIWGMEREKDSVSELLENVREAESFRQITDRCQLHGTEVLKLEKTLERIDECLEKQKEYLTDGKEALERCHGSAFLRAAERLKRELGKIPALTANYEKEADRLREKLAESEQEAERFKEDLKAGTWGLAAEELAEYRSYLEEEGEHRKEVRAVQLQAEKNTAVVDAAIQKAEEVQEYIDEWEPEDEEDELDEEALWRRVSRVLQEFEENSGFCGTGISDKKTMQVLELVSQWRGKDLLDLCMPENRSVSGTILTDRNLPSEALARGGGSGSGLGAKESIGTVLQAFSDRALMTEYTARYFQCFLQASADDAVSDAFPYEQEYLLAGFPEARENLKHTVHRLIAVREAANLLTLLSNPSLRREAETLAGSITGAAFGPLTGVITFFVLTVWAFAESVEDVRLLLDGGKLPFLKSEQEWKISLQLLSKEGMSALKTEKNRSEEGSGLDYSDYLKLFLFMQGRIETRYRMLDLMQHAIRSGQPDFQIAECACKAEAELICEGLFLPVRRKAVQGY